jgi:hypothetical protein
LLCIFEPSQLNALSFQLILKASHIDVNVTQTLSELKVLQVRCLSFLIGSCDFLFLLLAHLLSSHRVTHHKLLIFFSLEQFLLVPMYLFFQLTNLVFKKARFGSQTVDLNRCHVVILSIKCSLGVASCFKLHDPSDQLLVLSPCLINGLVSDAQSFHKVVAFSEQGLKVVMHLLRIT